MALGSLEMLDTDLCQNKAGNGGAWVARSVKIPTLDLSSGHDLTVREFKPHIRLCAESAQPTWDSHSLSLSLPLSPFQK